MDNQKLLLISYFPLLYGNPLDIKLIVPEEIEKIVGSLPSGLAAGCLWLNTDKGVSPVLVYDDKSAERCSHLLWWSDNKPEKWFKVGIHQNEHGYGVVLMPDLKRSCDRHKYIVQDSQFDTSYILFSPPAALCPSAQTFDTLKDQVSNHLRVGFIDKRYVVPDKFNIEFVNWIGVLEVDISDNTRIYMEKALVDMNKSLSE